jgi:hypothetical protein
MINYKEPRSPVGFNYASMSKQDAQIFLHWFISEMPKRIASLEKQIVNDTTSANWRADYSMHSLVFLDSWLLTHVECRTLSDSEFRQIWGSIPSWIPRDMVSSEVLTDMSAAGCYDIAYYWGSVLIMSRRDLGWQIGEDGVDRNMPVVVGRGPMMANPIQLIINHAHRVIRSNRSDLGLVKLFYIWKDLL